MKDLVGRSFAIAEERYLVVDVQRVAGDALIYTERLSGPGPAPGGPTAAHGPRTAFHYRDIADALASAASG